jgi:hypothetical protein
MHRTVLTTHSAGGRCFGPRPTPDDQVASVIRYEREVLDAG